MRTVSLLKASTMDDVQEVRHVIPPAFEYSSDDIFSQFFNREDSSLLTEKMLEGGRTGAARIHNEN